MTMPITFVSDCGTETYTEAKEREQTRKHEQATCVPITFIDDAMINSLMSRIDLVSKNLLANYFRNCRKRDNC